LENKLTQAPVLQTERLSLRGPERRDFPAFARFMTASPRMKAQGEVSDMDQAWIGLLAGVGHWHWHGYGFFMVCRKSDDVLVGRVGLLNHLNWPDVELAWHLCDGAEGHGYATEAGCAVQRWASEAHAIHQLYSYIHVDNQRSQAVAKRLGAATDGTRAAHEQDAEIWTHQTVG